MSSPSPTSRHLTPANRRHCHCGQGQQLNRIIITLTTLISEMMPTNNNRQVLPADARLQLAAAPTLSSAAPQPLLVSVSPPPPSDSPRPTSVLPPHEPALPQPHVVLFPLPPVFNTHTPAATVTIRFTTNS